MKPEHEALTRKRLNDIARMMAEWAAGRRTTLSVGERHILEDAVVACGMALRTLSEARLDEKAYVPVCREAALAIRALSAPAEERRDAERYRKLRARFRPYGKETRWYIDGTQVDGPTLDAAIDALGRGGA